MAFKFHCCLIVFAACVGQPAMAESEPDYNVAGCAEARAFLNGGEGTLALSGGMWIINCDKVGETETSAAVEARMRADLANQSTDAFVRANLGLRLALAYSKRKQLAEAARLVIAAQAEYLGQPERDEFTNFWFEQVSSDLGIDLAKQPELAAPHLDARVMFLDMLRDSEMHAYLPERKLPLALNIALGNALQLENLDRSALHAGHMARLRAETPPGDTPDRFLSASMIAKVAHSLIQAKRTEEAQTIIGDDPPVRALVAAYTALDAINPAQSDLDLSLRSIVEATDNPWWRAGLAESIDREREIVAQIVDGVAAELHHSGRTADADRVRALQHPQFER